MKKRTIALVGNPNCGKTTLFNLLTGSKQRIGNWPGVTVEKKEGDLKDDGLVSIVDLPGIYSLSPYSPEERIAKDFLCGGSVDAVVNIVDGTNLERNLYLTVQLMELGLNVIVAVNMMDEVEKTGAKLDFGAMSKALGAPVVAISALNGTGIKELKSKMAETPTPFSPGNKTKIYKGSVLSALERIADIARESFGDGSMHTAAQILEGNADILGKLDAKSRKEAGEIASECESKTGQSGQSLVIGQRYAFVRDVLSLSVKEKAHGRETLSDKIDRIVTHRILALPIFALLVWFMYYIAVSTVGSWLTDWANDGVFGDGFFLYKTVDREIFCSDEVNETNRRRKAEGLDPILWEDALSNYETSSRITEKWEEAYGIAAGGSENPAAGDGIDEEIAKNVSVRIVFEDADSAAIDEELTGEYGYGDYLEALKVQNPNPADYGLWMDSIPVVASGLMDKAGIGEDSMARRIFTEAVIGGVGTVLGFVPQILIVFVFLALFEASGYMARVAFIMDRFFRKFGLSGKSFIPILVGMGCAVPAILATRTIESEKERRMSIILSSYLPCGAKYAIIAVFTTAFFNGSSLVALLSYFGGIAIIVLAGVALKKTKAFSGAALPFVLELPPYRLPGLGMVMKEAWQRTKGYIVKAGTVIFPASVAIWLLMSFDFGFNAVSLEESMLHDIGEFFAWFFAPLGFGNWQGAVATITAEIAKEQAVADLAMLAGDSGSVGSAAGIFGLFASFNGEELASLTALSFMIMNIYDPPCLVAIATVFKETGNRKAALFAVACQTFIGYSLALMAYQLGKVFVYGRPVTAGTCFALAVLGAWIFLVARRGRGQ